MGNSIKRKIYKLKHPRPKRNKYFDLKEGEVNKVKLNSKFNVNWITNYTIPPKYREKFYYSSTENKNVEYIDCTSVYLGNDGVVGASTLVQFIFKAVKKGKDTIYFKCEPYEKDNGELDLEDYIIRKSPDDDEFSSDDDDNKNENKINSENKNDNQEHEDNNNDNNIKEEKKNNDNENKNIDFSQEIKYEVEII